MKKKLESELKALAEKVLKLNLNEDVSALQFEARKLYEKLTVLKFMEDRLNDIEIDTSKSIVADKFKEMATTVLEGNKEVPEANPHEEDIITKGIETIKGMVVEMPEKEESNFLENLPSQELFEKKEKEILFGTTNPETEVKVRSINDTFKKSINIGLNDKLAFIKHLFNGSSEDYNRVISQLNSFHSQEEVISFITNMVKLDYNNWEGKEEYESRFLEIVQSKFN